jgi:amidophosphoribosyltransferase
MDRIKGAYSLVICPPRASCIAVRDPQRLPPAVHTAKTADGSVVFASESCALDAVGAKFVRDILPGEIVVVDKTGARNPSSPTAARPTSTCACLSSSTSPDRTP